MSGPLNLVREVRPEDHGEVGFAEDDDVVETIAANGAHEALREGILPRRVWGGPDLFDAKRGDGMAKACTVYGVDGITGAQEVADRVVGKCLAGLLSNPFS